MSTIIREIRPEEHDLLREFLYQAIYLPEGVEPPPRSVVDLPELQIYIADFGTRPGDHCICLLYTSKFVYTSLEELLNFLESHMSNEAWSPEQVRAYFEAQLPKLNHWNCLLYTSET